MLLALAAAAASVYFFVIRSKFAPYQALAELNQSPELSMNLLLDADMGEEAFELSASVERKTAGGHRVTRVGFDDLPLYYAENLVVLENGHGVSAHVRIPGLFRNSVESDVDLSADQLYNTQKRR